MYNQLEKYAEENFFKLSAAVLFFAILIRLLSLNPFGVWFDEQCSLRGALGIATSLPSKEVTAKESPSHFVDFLPNFIHNQNRIENVLPATLAIDRGNGPLHNLSSFIWINTFGRSDVSVRLNTVLFSILSLVALLYFFSRVFGKTEAIAAGLLFATNPSLVKYGTQFRPYSFGTFWVVLSSALLYFIVADSKHRISRTVLYAAYFLTISATFFSHYLAAYILLAHLFFCAVYLRRWRAWISFAIVAGLLSSLFYLWLINGAAEGIKIMSEHSKLWATRQLEYGGFTFSQLVSESAKVIPKLLGLTTFGGSIESGSKLKVLYESFKIFGSITAVLVAYKFLKSRHKTSNNMALALLLITSGSCLIYSIYSSTASKHYLPFIDRYIMFAVTLGTGITAAISVSFYRQTQSRLLKTIAIVAFASQALTGLAKNSADIRRTKSYNWENKNLFVTAAHNVSQVDPEQVEVIYPTWNIATMTNIYLPKGFGVNQRLIVTEDPKNIYVRNKITGQEKFIEKNIEE